MLGKNITAEDLAEQFRSISVAEFLEKNRHLLGYENPTKSLITVVKELVDNSIDASEESGILPNVKISLKEIGMEKYRISVEDDGPGIVPEKVTSAFGKLLYGTKFHRLKMARGQQGIGVSGAILYSQLTTGKPAKIVSSTGKDIHSFELMIDISKNEPHIISHNVEKNPSKWHGIKIELETEGRYVEKAASVPEYLKQTAMMNPYANIIYDGPNGKIEFKRTVNELPPLPKEIKPHPYGVELGLLRRMLLNTNARNMIGFLTSDFSRVGRNSASQICKLAKLDGNRKPHDLAHEETERLHKAMQMVKLIGPSTDCLSPLGEKLLEEGLEKEIKAEFVVAVTRPPSVYRGNPFLIEVCMGFGGELPQNQTAQLFRFANKVPLLYHASDCATTEAVTDTDFRRYGFSQSSGQIPQGPLAILIHFASVWVPYTSEGKQAIASYPEIIKEMKLALQEAGRKLAVYVHKKKRAELEHKKRTYIEKYLPHIGIALKEIINLNENEKGRMLKTLEQILEETRESFDIEGEKIGDEETE